MKCGSISRERWSALEPLLDAALELEPARRPAFADDACAHDTVLRAELKALLLACEQGDGILRSPASVAFAPLLIEPDAPIPEQLGAYRLVREIGRGGMGTVYLADDPKHSRQVAVKVLHAQLARRIGRERFLREIEIAAGLSHPHILPLHDSGNEASILYFVSPFVPGESLRDRLQRAPRMPTEDVVRLGREIALALDYAHRQGVIHLDIKPDNVLLQEGHAVIADFGIARAMSDAGEETTGPQTLWGTPFYMSPEQASGDSAIDGRSDVYSLGCVLYEMVTGERTIARDPKIVEAYVPPALAAIIVRAMSASRDDRFATAGELARTLRDSVQMKAVRLPPRRFGVIRGAIAGGMLIVGAIAFLAAARRDGDVPAKSIAVLPFLNESPDSEQDYFSEGVTQDLSALLVKSAELRVARHTSQFRSAAQQVDVKAVAHQLGVAYLLRGSVQKSDSSLRVIVRLTKADGTTVWSDAYNRMPDDIFAVQADIADRAVKALRTTLLANALTANATPISVSSYNLVLRGRYLLMQHTRENAARAIDCFERAIAEEPRNAPAYAGLARAYRMEAGEGWISVADGFSRSRDAAKRAIAIDPTFADGYEALAYVQSAYDWDWDAAEANYRRALELEPGNADVLRSAALLMAKLGRYDEAIVGARKAVDRDPFVGAYSNLGYILGAAGRWDEAEAAARAALALGPNTVLRHFNLARALLFQGKKAGALREVELEKGENWRLMGEAIVFHSLGRNTESDRAVAEYEAKFAEHAAMQIADVHAYRGEVNDAFNWLDRAYAQRDPGIADVANDPWLRPLRSDPRYRQLLTKMRLTR